MRTATEDAVSRAVIALMRGVVHRETQEQVWLTLGRHGAALRDHFAVIGVEVVVDDTEGYAYLRSRPEDEGEEPLPRLVQRRTLSYPVSLLLVLLRRRLAEFEATGGETRLILTREQLVDLLVTFLPSGSNEARLVDQIDRHVAKVVELGFLHPLRGQDVWEVRSVIKAYVDAQTLADFDARLQTYREAADGDG
jgi:hypothetical protein